jgi:tetratricopeptide (TPR) repeat protein
LKQIFRFYGILCFILFCLLLISCKNNSNNSAVKQIDSLVLITDKIHEDPDNAELFSVRADLYFRDNKLPEAVKDGEYAIKIDSLKPKYYIRLCEYYIFSGKSFEAKDILLKCNKMLPNNTDILLKLSELYLFVKQYEDAMKYSKLAEDIDKQIPKIYFLRGIIFRERGDTAKSIENFRTAIDKNPQYYEAYIVLGLLYYHLSDSLAAEYYKAAIGLKPKSIEAHYNLGMYYQENNKENKAVDEYNLIINTIDSTYINAWFNIGYIYMVYMKKYNEAIPYFSRALSFDSTYVDAIYNRGYCFEKLGYYKKAREAFQKCNRMVPNYELAIKGLNRLEKAVN